MTLNHLHFEDCYDTLQKIPDGGIDMLLQDTPFEVTQNNWDVKPDLKIMWPEWERTTKQNAAMVFFATQPFASELILSNLKYFRYDLIWVKGERTSGFLNANKMPLRNHESILIFYRNLPTYNPQFTTGKATHKKGKPLKETNNNYGNYNVMPTRDYGNNKFPKSVISFEKEHPPVHPTQKPVDLIRWLIRTYTNENDVVFDGYAGSGSVALGCITEKRNFICCENKKEYFDLAQRRIDVCLSNPTLF